MTIAAISVVVTLGIITIAVFQTGWSVNIDFVVASKVGTLIAGLLTFSTILLLWLTLNSQIQVSRRSEIENHVFSGIQYHRENVNQFALSEAYDGVANHLFIKIKTYVCQKTNK